MKKGNLIMGLAFALIGLLFVLSCENKSCKTEDCVVSKDDAESLVKKKFTQTDNVIYFYK